MAIFHLSVKTISRSAGRSSTAAAAYRAAVQIIDQRTGEVHDYRRKGGVDSAELFLPADALTWANDRNELWNAAEKSENRKNSTVAREFEVALPAELNRVQRQELAHEFSKALVKKYGFAADCAIHLPGKEGDSKNHHAHILCSTRKLTAEGFTAKTRELDDRATGSAQVVECRELFASMTNAALEKAGHSARVDHRSLAAQGIDDRDAGIHLGPSATAIERRGEVSQKRMLHQERQQQAADKVAAMVAIAHAQASAKAAAHAALAAAIAAARDQREAALQAAKRAAEQEAKAQQAHSAKLTAALKEEDDGIRKTALAALASASAATERACAVAFANHAGSSKSIEACRSAGYEIEGSLHRSRSDLLASAKHVVAAQGVARNIASGAQSAVRGAQRRVARNYVESSAGAVGAQLGHVNHVLQQLVERFPNVVRSVAGAAYQVAQQITARLARQRAAAHPVETRSAKEVWAASPENPLNIAKREAAAKPAPRAAQIERRPAEPLRPAVPLSPPKPTEHEAQARLLETYRGMQAQWDAAVVAERALYLKELTKQAYDKTVAHVAEHQAHLNTKPMLFGREKWEAQRQSFERRDTANNHEWKTLKDGHYPLREQDKEAVQKAVERRVRDKNPALAQSMPKVAEALQAERGRIAAERQAQFLKDMEQAREAHAERQSLRGKGRGFSR